MFQKKFENKSFMRKSIKNFSTLSSYNQNEENLDWTNYEEFDWVFNYFLRIVKIRNDSRTKLKKYYRSDQEKSRSYINDHYSKRFRENIAYRSQNYKNWNSDTQYIEIEKSHYHKNMKFNNNFRNNFENEDFFRRDRFQDHSN
jgi:hypothetical protein